MRANCDAASCIVACGRDEILLTAHCGPRPQNLATCHRHEPASNPLIAACVSSASVSAFVAPTPAVSSHVVADGIPKLDIAQTCRAATENRSALNDCMVAEDRARERLASQWGQLAQADTKHCTQLSSMKGFQSNVELLTCLEMAADARTLPKDITQH